MSMEDHTFNGNNAISFWRPDSDDSAFGVYARGGCDLRSVFTAVELLRPRVPGRGCIRYDGIIAYGRKDLELARLYNAPPSDLAAEVIAKLGLEEGYFEPRLFDPTFRVEGPNGTEEYTKKVIVLTIGPDTVRTLYRHKKHGFLVDPGGGWLRSIESIMDDLSVVRWFRSEFESAGRVSVEDFRSNLAEVFRELQTRTSAAILVFNVLGPEPGDATYNYQTVESSETLRRREFNLALFDVAREFEVGVVDIDGLLKRVGTSAQVDFAHAPKQILQLAGQETVRAMEERAVI